MFRTKTKKNLYLRLIEVIFSKNIYARSKHSVHFIEVSTLERLQQDDYLHDYFFISNLIFWSVLELLIFAQNFSTGVAQPVA